MTNNSDYVCVGGNFLMQAYYSHSKNLTAGTLEVRGNFTQKCNICSAASGSSDNFAASGTNKVILNGSGTQTVSFDNPGSSCLNILQLSNPNGIVFSTPIAVNNLLGVGKVNSSLSLVCNTTYLSDSIAISGDLNLQSGTLNINDNILTLTGNLVLSGGTIDLAQGEIDVNGSLTQNGGTLNIDGGYLDVSGNYTLQNYSQLIMTNAYDYIFVNRNFTTNTSNNETGSLSDGVLEIKGDFTQGGDSCSFATSGSNMVILSGSKVQNIYFVNPQSSYFSNIDVSESAGVKCNYTRNFNINSILGTLPGTWPVVDVINALNKLGIVNINSYLDKSVNAMINFLNLQYILKQDVGYFVLGLYMAADSNLNFGTIQNIAGLFKITPPEDNYYYMLGKVTGDIIFKSAFEALNKVAIADAIGSLLAGVGFGAGGLATGPAVIPCEVVAVVELTSAICASAVAIVAGAGADRSQEILDSDKQKLQEAKDVEAKEGTEAGQYSGKLIKVNKPDPAADALAERIGGESRVKFENDPQGREFDAVSDEYIAQTKPALQTVNKSVRNQMKATFEAAQETGRNVYYHFEGQPAQSVIDKLNEYSQRYGIKVVIDTVPLK